MVIDIETNEQDDEQRVNKIKCYYKKIHKQKEIYHKEHIIREKNIKISIIWCSKIH